jgi:signal transduction histidine kinase
MTEAPGMTEDAAKEIRKFIHTINHDLQSPLAKIITLSELLSEKLTDIDPADREYLLRMHENGKRMKAQLDDLTRQFADRTTPR